MGRPAKFEITQSIKDKTVTVGEKVFTEPNLMRRKEWDFFIKSRLIPSHALRPSALPVDDFGLIDDGANQAARNKVSCEYLGPKFNRRFQAANYHVWIKPYMQQSTADLLRLSGKNWWQYDDNLVLKAHNVLEHVNSAERDGLTNIIPAIITLQDSPKNIRARVGRGAWRKIANMSKTKSAKIMRLFSGRDFDDIDSLYVAMLDLPSGVLPFVEPTSAIDRLSAQLCNRKNLRSFIDTNRLLHDAKHMLGDNFNPAWSLSRIKKEHDYEAKRLARLRYSDRPFADEYTFSHDGLIASLLFTPALVAEEGFLQRHCIASYAKRCRKGRYAAFRVEGRERATVGIGFEGGALPRLDQVYAACNQPVTRETKVFANLLVSRLRDAPIARAA